MKSTTSRADWPAVNFWCISMSLQLSAFGEKQIKHTEATSRQNKLSPCSQRRGEVRTPPQHIRRHICAPWPSNDVSFAEEIGQPWIPGSFHLKRSFNTLNRESNYTRIHWVGIKNVVRDFIHMWMNSLHRSEIQFFPWILNFGGSFIRNCKGTIMPTRPTFGRCQLGLYSNTESFRLHHCDCLIKCLAV